jgi:hypothetical protein
MQLGEPSNMIATDMRRYVIVPPGATRITLKQPAGYAVLLITKNFGLRLELWKPIPAVLYEGRFTK